jgi:hypothetical protein
MLDNEILILLITGSFASFALVVRYIFYSKCDSIKCGSCVIHRNTGQESRSPENNQMATPSNIV